MEPPSTTICDLSFPIPAVLLVTLNQPEKLNALPYAAPEELDRVWKRLDANRELTMAIFTGSGRAFCVRADLRGWEKLPSERRGRLPHNGFGGLSLHRGKKPIIAAVNGRCVGGATEMVLNCDMFVASKSATFAFPDVKVGLTGFGGAFPRLVQRIGRQRATDMTLTARTISVEEAEKWGLVDRIAEDAVTVAVDLAKAIVANSPDAIIATRDGMLMGESGMDAEEAGRLFIGRWLPRIMNGENIHEGIKAFNERRPPQWKKSFL